MKKVFIKVLLCVLMVSMAFTIVGCNNSKKNWVDPIIADISADVVDETATINLGSANLTKVTIGDVETSKYKVESGILTWTDKFYGAFGVGSHKAVFKFDNFKDVTINLNIVDAKAPIFTMPEEGKLSLLREEAIELPTISNRNQYQAFKVGYKLKDAEGVVLKEAGDDKTDKIIEFEAKALEIGSYSYEISIMKGTEQIANQKHDVWVGEGLDVFSKSWTEPEVGNPGLAAQAVGAGWMSFAWNEEKGGPTVNVLNDGTSSKTTDKYKINGKDIMNEYTSNNRRFGIPDIFDVKALYEIGYKYLTFEYFSELNASAENNYGFAIWGNLDSNKPGATDKTEGGLCRVGYLYDIVGTKGGIGRKIVNNEWTSYTIDLEKFFTVGGKDTFGISFVILGDATSKITFRNSYFSEKSPASKMYNLMTEINSSAWTAQAEANISREWDATNSALKVTCLTDGTTASNQFTSNNRRIYFKDLKDLNDCYKDGSANILTFEYFSNLEDGTTAKKNFGFRIYPNDSKLSESKNMVSASEIKTISGDALVKGVWTKVTIDLSKLFVTGVDVNGISIVVVGNTGSTIMFRNMTGSYVKA